MTMALSGSRPMVTTAAIGHRFTTLSSTRRMSLGTVPSRRPPVPAPPEAAPGAADHEHDDDGDVVGAALLVGLVHEVVADALRIAQTGNRCAQRLVGDRARQAVAAEQHVIARLHGQFLQIDADARFTAEYTQQHVAGEARA